jgi:hypothetical protein
MRKIQEFEDIHATMMEKLNIEEAFNEAEHFWKRRHLGRDLYMKLGNLSRRIDGWWEVSINLSWWDYHEKP